jgi:hypothetical protein
MISNDSEFLLYAMNHYDNTNIVFVEEFEADLKRFVYINNLINRYRINKCDLKDRLIINHIITLENCFGLPSLLKLCQYKIQEDNKKQLNTFLYYMERLSDCEVDQYLLDKLNENR